MIRKKSLSKIPTQRIQNTKLCSQKMKQFENILFQSQMLYCLVDKRKRRKSIRKLSGLEVVNNQRSFKKKRLS